MNFLPKFYLEKFMPTLENRLGAAAQLTEITHRLTPRFYLESLRIATRIPHCVNVSLGVTHVEHGKRVKIHIGTSKESQPKNVFSVAGTTEDTGRIRKKPLRV